MRTVLVFATVLVTNGDIFPSEIENIMMSLNKAIIPDKLEKNVANRALDIGQKFLYQSALDELMGRAVEGSYDSKAFSKYFVKIETQRTLFLKLLLWWSEIVKTMV